MSPSRPRTPSAANPPPRPIRGPSIIATFVAPRIDPRHTGSASAEPPGQQPGSPPGAMLAPERSEGRTELPTAELPTAIADAWVVGDEPCVSVDFGGYANTRRDSTRIRAPRSEPGAAAADTRVLAGRATSVPSTAVLTGSQGTTTNSAMVPRPAPFIVCASDEPARSGFAAGGQRGLSRPSNWTALRAFLRLLKVVCWQSASNRRRSGILRRRLCWWA
jgi:hypothetical protein